MSVRNIMQDISESVSDQKKKTNITNAIDYIERFADEYDSLAKNHMLHCIIPTQQTGTALDATDMKKLYSDKFSKGALKEKYYDKLMALAKNGKCPICGIGQVSNLDHYLAKSIYPVYAITPTNLTPICRDCNFQKLDKAIEGYVYSPFHPYYDDIDDMIWLVAKIIKQAEGNLVVEYFVNPDISQTNSELYNKMNEHCKLYKLFKLYSIQASTEIADKIMAWQSFATREGNEKLKNLFKDYLLTPAGGQKNTWYTALFRALVDNIAIIL